MATTSLDYDPARPAGCSLPGVPWSFRVAGGRSARPALELYEGGVLLDVVSSTPIAPRILRGARAAAGDGGRERTLAWGRLPAAGACLAVQFGRGNIRRRAYPAAVIEITGWCWLAVANGRFSRVVATFAGRSLIHKVSGGPPWR